MECVASDHRAFNMAQKAAGKDDFRHIPAGLNGVAERLTVVWDRAVVSDARSTRSIFTRRVSYCTAAISIVSCRVSSPPPNN